LDAGTEVGRTEAGSTEAADAPPVVDLSSVCSYE
jgi:hypothetical protein